MSDSQVTATGPITRGAYPELTPHAVLVGYFLGVILAISIGYASLKLGFSIEGSELAAILGFGILRGILRRRSIIENNVAQTVASAVNGASSGMMFSVPAIFILGYGLEFNPYVLTFGAIAGAFLGIAFIIPLRKQMIDFERLTYPGGVAVASILKSPGAGIKKAMLLVGAMVVSGLVHVLSLYTGVEYWPLFEQLGLPDYLNGTWYLSLMTIGVAFIAGRGGLAFIIGGFVCYWFIAPMLDLTNSFPVVDGVAVTDPNQLRLMLFRPTGIGMLIGGAVIGVLFALPLIKSAIKSMQSSAKKEAAMSKDELPIKLLYFAVVGAAILLGVMAVTSAQEVGLIRGIMMAVLGTLWIWMAGIILSEAIGRTNWSPLSGMTLIAVTLLIMITQTFGGMSTGSAIVAAVTVGAATCVAMSQATDLMLDMKTGYLVGATPRQQQLGQFFGAWLGPIVIIILIFTLDKAFGLGGDEFPAPQGQALASMVQGITGGDVPSEKYFAGALLGGLLSLLQAGLGITVGLGFYLPFEIVLTYALGTLLREVVDRTKGKSWSESVGIPIAAGLIVGEALVGVGNAVYVISTAG
ncbi:OPT/YSL family transporter [Marinicella sp. S1101]|uniref:OPT family oligopeptide transporter n=1 Tax=Marinicella marina TaxID=2996016 RepID=UPI002260878C|nr:OPT/YSL family transporter [Marinicella marina]MCX7552335.1 OPT/YSL family transporter [Marinicella marina]MDJ1139210.1 OPT/YSL family transporter [Marinicella marina]